MHFRSAAATLVLLPQLLTVSPLAAQATRSNTSKLILGLELNGTSATSKDLNVGTASGAGLTLRIGYGFTPVFALLFEGAAATVNGDNADWEVGHFDFAARFHFAKATRAVVPFLDVGLTGRSATTHDAQFDNGSGGTYQGDAEVSGSGLTLGGGLLFFFSPKLALSTGLKWTVGEISTVRVNNISVSGFEADATTTRVNLGISWFPMLGR